MERFEKLGKQFFKHPLQPVDDSSVKSAKVLLLYFGAHWAEPCLHFNPTLINFYNDVRADDPSRLEIVYISMDSHDKYFQQDFQHMPWVGYAFKDPQRIKMIMEYKKDLKGIPAVFILNSDCSIASTRGRGDIELKGTECYIDWLSKIDKLDI